LSAGKVIAIVVLFLIGAHLLLYSLSRRRIQAAKREKAIDQ
jgi:hypothetical protein